MGNGQWAMGNWQEAKGKRQYPGQINTQHSTLNYQMHTFFNLDGSSASNPVQLEN